MAPPNPQAPPDPAARNSPPRNPTDGNTSGTETDPDAHYSADMRASMKVLRALQSKHDALYQEFNIKRRELEELYESLYEPVYRDRKTELDKGHIASFWLTAMENCKLVAENITDKDRNALEFLKNLSCHTVTLKESQEKVFNYPAGTIILKFLFEKNPYFENEVLTKVYVMDNEDDEELKKTVGTEIKWKRGKNLTVKVLRKRVRNNIGGTKIMTKTEPCDSFFNFFSPPKVEEDSKDAMAKEEIDALDALVAADFEVGETICSEIIARAVLWYADEMSDSEGEDDGDSEDDSELDSDEDSDSSSEEREYRRDNGQPHRRPRGYRRDNGVPQQYPYY